MIGQLLELAGVPGGRYPGIREEQHPKTVGTSPQPARTESADRAQHHQRALQFGPTGQERRRLLPSRVLGQAGTRQDSRGLQPRRAGLVGENVRQLRGA